MPGTMLIADLAADLKASRHDSASIFRAEHDFTRFLRQALPDMQLKRPLTLIRGVDLQANVPQYSLASIPNFAAYKTHLWGGYMPKPWEQGYPDALPCVSAVRDADQW